MGYLLLDQGFAHVLDSGHGLKKKPGRVEFVDFPRLSLQLRPWLFSTIGPPAPRALSRSRSSTCEDCPLKSKCTVRVVLLRDRALSRRDLIIRVSLRVFRPCLEKMDCCSSSRPPRLPFLGPALPRNREGALRRSSFSQPSSSFFPPGPCRHVLHNGAKTLSPFPFSPCRPSLLPLPPSAFMSISVSSFILPPTRSCLSSSLLSSLISCSVCFFTTVTPPPATLPLLLSLYFLQRAFGPILTVER